MTRGVKGTGRIERILALLDRQRDQHGNHLAMFGADIADTLRDDPESVASQLKQMTDQHLLTRCKVWRGERELWQYRIAAGPGRATVDEQGALRRAPPVPPRGPDPIIPSLTPPPAHRHALSADLGRFPARAAPPADAAPAAPLSPAAASADAPAASPTAPPSQAHDAGERAAPTDAAAASSSAELLTDAVRDIIRAADGHPLTSPEIAERLPEHLQARRDSVARVVYDLRHRGVIIAAGSKYIAQGKRFRANLTSYRLNPAAAQEPDPGSVAVINEQREAPGFRCAVYSDGALYLRSSMGWEGTLPPEDTRQFFAYLDRTVLGVDREDPARDYSFGLPA